MLIRAKPFFFPLPSQKFQLFGFENFEIFTIIILISDWSKLVKMADIIVNIDYSDIANVVLKNIKPDNWEIGERRLTYSILTR